MNLAKLVNAIGNWIADRTLAQWKIAALIAFVGLAVAFVKHHDAEQRDIGYRLAKEAESARTVAKLAHIRDSIGKNIDTQTVTLTRVLHRTDTLLRQIPETIVTHEDTVRAIQGLPALRLSTDSAIKACSDYQSMFTRYRTVCDSLDAARKAQIADLQRQLDATKPSKVRRVVTWAAILGAGYVGFKAGRR